MGEIELESERRERERLMTAVLQHFVDRYMHHCKKRIQIYALLGFFERLEAS